MHKDRLLNTLGKGVRIAGVVTAFASGSLPVVGGLPKSVETKNSSSPATWYKYRSNLPPGPGITSGYGPDWKWEENVDFCGTGCWRLVPTNERQRK